MATATSGSPTDTARATCIDSARTAVTLCPCPVTKERGGSPARTRCWIDRRADRPELYVSDRKNHRLQVFDLDGGYQRVVGNESVFRRPGGFAVYDNYLFVAELEARLAVLGQGDHLVGYLGGDDDAAARPGFPNELDDHQHPVRPADLRPGYFNSPHGLTADRDGNLYVTEFLIGGRLIKLTRRSG